MTKTVQSLAAEIILPANTIYQNAMRQMSVLTIQLVLIIFVDMLMLPQTNLSY